MNLELLVRKVNQSLQALPKKAFGKEYPQWYVEKHANCLLKNLMRSKIVKEIFGNYFWGGSPYPKVRKMSFCFLLEKTVSGKYYIKDISVISSDAYDENSWYEQHLGAINYCFQQLDYKKLALNIEDAFNLESLKQIKF